MKFLSISKMCYWSILAIKSRLSLILLSLKNGCIEYELEEVSSYFSTLYVIHLLVITELTLSVKIEVFKK